MGQERAAPTKARIWAVTVAGLYPVLLVLVTVADAVVPHWPGFARLAVIAPIAVAWIVWGFAPVQRRVLARWR